jgi:tetratricopeptide (TPR) repeat protein
MSDRLQTLQGLLEESPNDPFLLFAIAKEYEKRSDDDRALAYYQQLHQNTPDYVGLYYHLGKLYERREQWEQALDTYKKGMEVARQAGDQHALSELAGASMNLEEE